MKIMEFYETALKDMRITDNDGEGLLTGKHGEEEFAVSVGGKRLCLPTQEILRKGEFDNLQPFHPLCENVTLGESEMIQAIRDYVELRMNVDTMTMMSALTDAAVDTASQKKLGAKASQFLRKVGAVDAKFSVLIEKLEGARAANPKRKMVSVFLLRGGLKDSPASRTAVVTFPLLEALDDVQDGKVWGVDIRKKDIDPLRALLEYVFFGKDDPADPEISGQYTYGTRSMEAPFFHALMTSFYKFGGRINQLLDIHHKHMDAGDVERLRYDLSWIPALDNFHAYRGVIPPMEGNIGVPMQGSRTSVEDRTAANAFSKPAPEKKAELPWDTNAPGKTASYGQAPTPAQSPAQPASDAPTTSLADFNQRLFGNQQQRYGQRNNFMTGFRDQNHEYHDQFQTRNYADRGYLNNRLPGGRPNQFI